MLNWHRDERGVDRTILGDVSVGLTLSNLIWQSSASIIRYSLHFQNQLDELGKIIVPPDATSLQRRVAQGLGIWSEGLMPQVVSPYADEQFLTPSMISVPKIATAVRYLQPYVKPMLKRNGRLWITDWTTFHTSRADADSMVLYHRSPLRSVIPHVSDIDRREAEISLPVDLRDHLNEQVLKSFLNRRGYSWSDFIVGIIAEYVQETYIRIRGQLVTSLAQTKNILRFYSPTEVSLPADALESWNMIYQVCANRGISTSMFVDGYAIVPFNPILRNRDNSDWLVNRVVAYGHGQFETYLRQGIPRERLDVISPPFLTWVNKNRVKDYLLDAVVLTWTPNVLDPNSKFWAPMEALRSAISALLVTGHRRIGVKIKHQSEVAYVRSVCEEMGIRASILSGRFYQHAYKAPLFIGGISTAMAEVVGRGARYVLFEPLENGYSDEILQIGTVIAPRLTARNEPELRHLLEIGECSWLGDPSLNLLYAP